MAKNRHPVDILYKEADDADKVWIEAVNKYWADGGLRSYKSFFDNYIKSTESLAKSIVDKLPRKPKVAADIGAGYGGVAVNLAMMGILVLALEPGKRDREVIEYFIGKNPSARGNIKVIAGVSEKLPFDNGSVDLCVLSQVLEHVEDVDGTISEISRVLKVGGFCHLSSPNYLFPEEQHYHLPYLPLMPKWIFSLWAMLLLKVFNISNVKNPKNRDFSNVADFIFDVNYTTDKLIRMLCKKHSLEIVWSLGEQEKDLFQQVRYHWKQNPGLVQAILICVSMPKKLFRCVLANMGLLPMKLEYLIEKTPGLKKPKVKKVRRYR